MPGTHNFVVECPDADWAWRPAEGRGELGPESSVVLVPLRQESKSKRSFSYSPGILAATRFLPEIALGITRNVGDCFARDAGATTEGGWPVRAFAPIPGRRECYFAAFSFEECTSCSTASVPIAVGRTATVRGRRS